MGVFPGGTPPGSGRPRAYPRPATASASRPFSNGACSPLMFGCSHYRTLPVAVVVPRLRVPGEEEVLGLRAVRRPGPPGPRGPSPGRPLSGALPPPPGPRPCRPGGRPGGSKRRSHPQSYRRCQRASRSCLSSPYRCAYSLGMHSASHRARGGAGGEGGPSGPGVVSSGEALASHSAGSWSLPSWASPRFSQGEGGCTSGGTRAPRRRCLCSQGQRARPRVKSRRTEVQSSRSRILYYLQ